jgi:hypothetical protein
MECTSASWERLARTINWTIDNVDHGKRPVARSVSICSSKRSILFRTPDAVGPENDLRFQATQSVHDVAVAPHASRQALLGLGSDDMWNAEQIHDPLEYWADDRTILIVAAVQPARFASSFRSPRISFR